MRFKLPFNSSITVRLCERVQTTDPQYDIVDCGLEYETGRIDSLAIGGSFSSLKSWTAPSSKNENKAARRKRRRRASKERKGATPASEDTSGDA